MMPESPLREQNENSDHTIGAVQQQQQEDSALAGDVSQQQEAVRCPARGQRASPWRKWRKLSKTLLAVKEGEFLQVLVERVEPTSVEKVVQAFDCFKANVSLACFKANVWPACAAELCRQVHQISVDPQSRFERLVRAKLGASKRAARDVVLEAVLEQYSGDVATVDPPVLSVEDVVEAGLRKAWGVNQDEIAKGTDLRSALLLALKKLQEEDDLREGVLQEWEGQTFLNDLD